MARWGLIAATILVLSNLAGSTLFTAVNGNGVNTSVISWEWFNPFGVSSFSAIAAGLSLSIFIF